MTFDFNDSYNILKKQLQLYMINNATRLPDYVTELLLDIAPETNPIDELLQSAEILYAAKDELNNPARLIVARIFKWLSDHDQYGVNQDDRAQNIISAMRRDLDEPPPPFGWPNPADDPAPLERYLASEIITEET